MPTHLFSTIEERRAPAGFFIPCPLLKQTDPNRDIPSRSRLSRAKTSPFPKPVEPGCEERAAHVETTLPKQTDSNRDIPSRSWLSRATTSPFPKLVEPGCEERVARVETTLPKQTDPGRDIPSRSWLSRAARNEQPVSKPR